MTDNEVNNGVSSDGFRYGSVGAYTRNSYNNRDVNIYTYIIYNNTIIVFWSRFSSSCIM